MPDPSFTLDPRGPYSLAASSMFLCGFTPATGGATVLEDGRLVLAFLDETKHTPVAVALEQDGVDGAVRVEGSPHLAPQVARILSLDHDGRGLPAVLDRDPVVGRAFDALPGFRPVCFPSAYEAAIWGVLAQRVPMKVASRLKQRLSDATGSVARAFGGVFYPAPRPEAVVELDTFPGLSDEKVTRLKGIAAAGLEGKLETSRLRAMPYAEAHAQLRALRGVGAWTADHVLVRGCGLADVLPTGEPRVLRAIAEAYGLSATPTEAEAEAVAHAWRPYRTWVSVRLVMALARTERWHGPERRGRRAAAA